MLHPCWFVSHSSFVAYWHNIRYIGIHFAFGLLDCAPYNEDFVKSRFVISKFCSIHFTVTLAGLKIIVRYIEVR